MKILSTRFVECLVVLLLMALSVKGQSALNYSGVNYYDNQGIYYSISNLSEGATASVNGHSSGITGEIVIPAQVTYGGVNYDVTAITNTALQNCTGITAITVPASVTSIGKSAFEGCTGIVTADLMAASGLKTISHYVFSGCTKLTMVKLPTSISSVGDGVFYNCPINEAHIGVGTYKILIDYFPESANVYEDIVTIGTSEYATICSSNCDLDFSGITDFKAYAGKVNSNNTTVELTEVSVAAVGAGLIINGTPGAYEIGHATVAETSVVDESGNAVENNLVGLTEAKNLQSGIDGYTNYCLAKLKSGEVGFKVITSSAAYNATAGKAYLQIASSKAAAKTDEFTFALGDETSDISGVYTNHADNDVYHNINGMKVDRPTKGIYIKNGKKIIVF